MKKKKENTGKSSATVEENRVLTDKETTPNGNIKFEITKGLSLTDGEVIQPIFKWKFMTLSSKKLMSSQEKRNLGACNKPGFSEQKEMKVLKSRLRPRTKKKIEYMIEKIIIKILVCSI